MASSGRWTLVSLCLALASPAILAGPITDFVTVGERQWAQPADFMNLSWEDVDAVCPAAQDGVCTEAIQLNGFAMLGWTWAHIPDVNELLNSFLALDGLAIVPASTHGSVSKAESLFGPAFFSLFRPTYDGSNDQRALAWTRSLRYYVPATKTGFIEGGGVYDYVNPLGGDNASTANPISSRTDFNASPTIAGGWFYRPVPEAVPAPPTLLLFLLGAMSAWMRARWTVHRR